MSFNCLQHVLSVEGDKLMSAAEVAKISDNFESNFWADGRFKGLQVTVDRSPGQDFRHQGQVNPRGVNTNRSGQSSDSNQARNFTNVPKVDDNRPSRPSAQGSVQFPYKHLKDACWKCGLRGTTHWKCTNCHNPGQPRSNRLNGPSRQTTVSNINVVDTAHPPVGGNETEPKTLSTMCCMVDPG